jgi:hypothetical protein
MRSDLRSTYPASDKEQFRDVGEACVPVVGETVMAEKLRRDGKHVVVHEGRYWADSRLGFYRPVNDLARLSVDEATWPTIRAWGFRACLTDSDARHANGALPAHLVSDLDGFDEELLSSSQRYKLRKARRKAKIVELTGPALLHDQGYEVLVSARKRTGYGALPSRAGYLAALGRFGEPGGGIVLAGLIGGRLGGYITGYAVDGTAYVGTVVIATEALSTHVSTGLTYEFVFACRRSGNIHELVHGLHAPEDEGLCRYKEWLSLPVRHLPSRVKMVPAAAAFIRRRSPHVYYRMTGRGNGWR